MRLLVPVLLLGIAIGLAAGGINGGAAWPAAALVLLAAVIAIVEPAEWQWLSSRLSKATLGPVSVELIGQASVAADQVSDFGEKAPGADPGDGVAQKTLLELRLTLESRMAYLAKHLLDDQGRATFVTIGSLLYDGYLTTEQAQTATAVMTLNDRDLVAFDSASRGRFLGHAAKVVDSFRASVFWGMVRTNLKRRGFYVTEVTGSTARDDLLVEVDQCWFRVAPALAVPGNEKTIDKIRRRLQGTIDEPPAVAGAMMAIPDQSADYIEESDGVPGVVKLSHLADALSQAAATSDGGVV